MNKAVRTNALRSSAVAHLHFWPVDPGILRDKQQAVATFCDLRWAHLLAVPEGLALSLK